MRTTVLAAAIVCLAAPSPTSAQSEGRIRVIGRAQIEVVPDFVAVRVSVLTTGASPAAALEQNSAAARRIVDFAKKFGVEERYIQTDAVSFSPVIRGVRDPNGTSRQEHAYTAVNGVRVRLSDLSRLGMFMRQVLDQGATNIGGVQFGLSNSEKAVDEARAKAFEDAVRQARQLAEAARLKLGKIQDIAHPPRSDSRGAEGAVDVLRREAGGPPPIESGTLQVSADVEITWAVE